MVDRRMSRRLNKPRGLPSLPPHPPLQSRQRKKAKCQQLAQSLEAMRTENAALAEQNEGMRRVSMHVCLDACMRVCEWLDWID